jgi:hypothetical protein
VSSLLSTCQLGEFLTLDGQTGTFHVLWTIETSGQQDPVELLF